MGPLQADQLRAPWLPGEAMVRFHSLPGSQRYAESEEQYTEILRRHATILADLLSEDGEPGDTDLLVVIASWSAGQLRTALEAAVAR